MWRVGTKVPINVYDGDRPVCQCHNEEDAKLIIASVNAVLLGRSGLRANMIRVVTNRGYKGLAEDLEAAFHD